MTANFISNLISEDIKNKNCKPSILTRFPPEPNGFLHIGHAKSICLNYSLAEEFNGRCNLRFDDTNPEKEEAAYVRAITEDLKWLGFDCKERVFFASDYFEQMFGFAKRLIQSGDAYVCDLNPEQIREYRGTLKKPGTNSPYRERSVDENMDLFLKMRHGGLENGSKVLRAKIDMSSPNLNLRDPVMYRILKSSHHRTGDEWPIYPMYDWAHGLEDSLEGVTHSLCTLEFESHRPLYDWFLDRLNIHHPRQIEFARLNIAHMALSKRLLFNLVKNSHVSGWDDPRMPTLAGLRRRGFTPDSIRNFCARIGVSKSDNLVDNALLEYCLREDLNKRAPRFMGVVKPLRVIIENYPENQTENIDAVINPEDPEAGKREVPFSREIFIDRDDFMEDPPKKYFRLTKGREVRLRYAYFITCTDIIKNSSGEVIELKCTYDPDTKGGDSSDGRKVKATLHWVSAKHAIRAEIQHFAPLFNSENPLNLKESEDPLDDLNSDSKIVFSRCPVEPHVRSLKTGEHFQFERMGYYCVEENSEKIVLNRSVTLRDTWKKVQKKGAP